jgi:flagellar assembly protein FliH
MATIIKAEDIHTDAQGVQRVTFNLSDLSVEAGGYLDRVRQEAARIVSSARQEAEQIRRDAEIEGQQSATENAQQAVRQTVTEQLTALVPTIQASVDEFRQMRESWLKKWEENGLRLAVAIAERVIRRELSETPDITAGLIREAIELASGSGQIELRLHPVDKELLGAQAERIADEFRSLAKTEVVADPTIERGGCRVETQFGSIDQQITTQLNRIESELLAP